MSEYSNVPPVTVLVISETKRDVCVRSVSLDGKAITDVERQFLKNWKAMRNVDRRLMLTASAGDSEHDGSGTTQLSAGTPPKQTVSSAGTQQQSVLVVSARRSASEPTNVEMSVVPSSAVVSARQPLYYDSQSPTH